MTSHPRTSTPSTRGRAGRRTRGLRTAAAIVAAILGGLVLVLALGNAFPPTANYVTLAAAVVWAWVGPQLVVVSALAVILSVPLWLAGRRKVLRGVASGLAVAALVASTIISGVLVNAGSTLGGSVDLAGAVALSASEEGPDEVTSYTTVDGEAQEARVYEPEDPEGAPVMMYIHGGAWAIGTAAESDASARWYADQGWYVVNVDYRLSTAEDPTWDKAPADVGCALSWAAQRAGAAGADPERLTVTGDSAGGHLALLLSWSAAADRATTSCPDLGEVPVPEAVVASYPVGDIQYTYDYGNAALGLEPKDFISDFLGGEPSEVPDRLAAVSPSTYFSEAAPATFVLQPERDDFIPAEGNHRLVEQAQSAGVDASIASIPFSHHGFDIIPGSLGDQIKRTVTVAWLQEQGLAP
ncbi:alpha/beta hydrolase [Rathayibacter sp. VKM Ac-2856]|uniref:alpha/beta hydrolase n=1 Tax=unclassified Rathayibacter TaxID=2609250 RepID=UPI001563A57D|nr:MULTISPECIES: alpha/beta hydrolase [unclassified Rathayibacter]NQX06891.1 alpha/beta hydrolase [Rathayibacter sp. VKM Ac-2858]NQX22058.1 alpha/beta hydrolase [Rathayibacter sp. VKM Ac-2856]